MLVLAAFGCGGDDLVLPDDGQPAAIEVVEGNGQSAGVGALLAAPLVVRVLDAEGRPVPSLAVAFVVVSGNGALAPDTVPTDANGRASSRWTLGSGAGAQAVEARVVDAPALRAAFTANAGAGTAATFEKVSGDAQSATAGSTLTDSLIVRALDAAGNPVAGVQVDWALAGGGTVSAPTTTTDAAGRTGVLRTLGTTAGAQSTTATAVGVGSPLTFTATALVGSVGRLTIATQPPSSTPSGARFSRAPQVQLRDANGNPVAQGGLAVTATLSGGPAGGDLVGSTTAATNSSGLATFSTLGVSGPAGGGYTLNFTAAGASGVTSSAFSLTAGSATRLVVSTQPSATATSGSPFAQQPVVQLVDASGTAVAQGGVSVTATIASGGGSLGGSTTRTTDASGAARFTDLAISGADGTRTLIFASSGLSSVTSAGIAVTQPPSVPNPANSSVGAAPGTVPTGGTSTITIVVRDALNAPMAGVSVSLSATGSGNTLSTPAPTDANGQTTATISSTVEESKTITATAAGVTLGQTTVSFLAPVSGSQSTITSSSSTVVAGGTVSITVTLRNSAGTPADGIAVSLSATGAGNSITPAQATTGASGVATFTFSSTVAEAKSISASAAGVTLGPVTVTVDPAPISAAKSTASVPNGKRNVVTVMTVTTRDALGNALTRGGALVTGSVSGKNAGALVFPTDNGDGTYSLRYMPLSRGDDFVTIRANGAVIAGSPYKSKVS